MSSTNGGAAIQPTDDDGEPSPARRCPLCGVSGGRFVRSTGRQERDAENVVQWYFVTFCAGCGYVYGRTLAP